MPRWNSCNILQLVTGTQRLWHFDAKGNGFALNRELAAKPGDPLPARLTMKSWGSLWRKKLNVAWLPPENVFIKLIELPDSNFEETVSMVELQLEKLSPIPVTQCVWSLHILPRHGVKAADAPALQTVLVVLVERSVVEGFLGQLEGAGYLADRLELPMLDQLEAADAKEDGAWIYPLAMAGQNIALIAWWMGGILRDLSLVTLPPAGSTGESLKSQFARLAWAGELEGWLTGPHQWHLVADTVNAALWETALRENLGETITVTAPLPPIELAGRTARRATAASERASLLPAEYSVRYHQQFVDRLWLRALMAVGVLYGVVVAIYFCALFCPLIGLESKTEAVEQQVVGLGGSFTNALQLQARYGVLKEREDLKYAALDCWQLIAEQLPAGVSISRMSFSDGQKISLSGQVPQADLTKIIDLDDALHKAKLKDTPVFDPVQGDAFQERQSPGGQVAWSFGLVLKNSEGTSK